MPATEISQSSSDNSKIPLEDHLLSGFLHSSQPARLVVDRTWGNAQESPYPTSGRLVHVVAWAEGPKPILGPELGAGTRFDAWVFAAPAVHRAVPRCSPTWAICATAFGRSGRQHMWHECEERITTKSVAAMQGLHPMSGPRPGNRTTARRATTTWATQRHASHKLDSFAHLDTAHQVGRFFPGFHEPGYAT